ncbi:MAG: alpha/beta hydrolase [Candidatus Nanopelagicales bacterium]
MTTFVLVHGAFRGGWAWDRVVPLLDGHRVLAPSLPQAGERYDGSDPLVTLPDYVEDVRALLERDDLRDVVLVGHSQGGVVALALRAVAPSRISSVVLLDAPAPLPGTSVAEVVPEDVRARYGAPPPPETWLPATPLAVDEALGIADELAAWANPLLTPAPAGPAYDPLPHGGDGVPVRHVFFARTPAYYPCGHTRARLDAEGSAYDVLDAGHDAPLTHPDLVAALLLDHARGRE